MLKTMHQAARDALDPLVTAEQLQKLCGAAYKLEVVLGRLWGTVGSDALDCVLALRIDVPNEAHILAALHLLRGGTHVTVNFDVGIELAYDPPGAGNCAVTLAVLARADGDRPAAIILLDGALADYTAGRPDGRPVVSGQALAMIMSNLSSFAVSARTAASSPARRVAGGLAWVIHGDHRLVGSCGV